VSGVTSAEATSRFAETVMMRVHYHEAGPAQGSRASPDERFRVLMPDQPGFGRSAAPPVEGNYFTFSARALASLLDHVGIEKIHLVGNSLGGGTAVRFALNYPDPGRRAGADGAGRAVPERFRPRSDRGRQPAGRVRGAAGTEQGEDGHVPAHAGVQRQADQVTRWRCSGARRWTTGRRSARTAAGS